MKVGIHTARDLADAAKAIDALNAAIETLSIARSAIRNALTGLELARRAAGMDATRCASDLGDAVVACREQVRTFEERVGDLDDARDAYCAANPEVAK